ncbi:lasso peptide biosynthesis PqqD family chaperone [Sporomusa sp. KB1]|jgi:hypothetical protein|uniref:lasso peptide biosynthesis PqqD family chaperone n=1 Tax=Sporomusa sp. KB1 TaxID=943346 RepID=UPI0011A289AF|nr:lasso peptide biosynthesis PqqD family chaperone [Sporomusa sp. KB1]TWH45939.1 coenzyme PQQ synthesis protein D (PqqD) [Sporomusa sp. KB1]
MENKITASTVVMRAAGLVATDLEGEKVMLDIEKGLYYGLDSIGSRIWDLMEQPQPMTSIVSVLMDEYEVAQQQCEADVLVLLNQMYAAGLLNIA